MRANIAPLRWMEWRVSYAIMPILELRKIVSLIMLTVKSHCSIKNLERELLQMKTNENLKARLCASEKLMRAH